MRPKPDSPTYDALLQEHLVGLARYERMLAELIVRDERDGELVRFVRELAEGAARYRHCRAPERLAATLRRLADEIEADPH